jgi:hypothetical protein
MTEGASFRTVSDDDLGYERSRTAFTPGQVLELDENYRLAHLPFVAPAHPGVIPRVVGKGYEMGRHAEAFSLVLPINPDALEASPAYGELVADIQAQGFASKIAWDIATRRRKRLHATLCGGWARSNLPETERNILTQQKNFGVELRGLFSGNINLGRLYLKLYPEERGGENCIGKLQQALGQRETGLYVVGLFNLVDDLDALETAELAALIDRWWDRPLLRFEARELWLLGARDDLVLDSRIVERISLRAPRNTPRQATSTRRG